MNGTRAPYINLEIVPNQFCRLCSSFDDTDGFVVPENLPPLMSLSLQSRDVLELTVTKSFIGVINTLTQSFTEINDQTKKQA